MKAFALDGIVGMAAKRLTKRAIRDIVETVSGELPATFADDVLKRISAATYVTTFATFAVLVLPRGGRCRGVRDIVTVHEQTESSCASVYRANDFKSIHALRQNINTVAMLTSDALLRHFSKGMYHAGIGGCTLLSLMYS